MDKLNEYAGLIAIISVIVLVAASAVTIFLLLSLRKKLAVQRLKFLGQFSADPDSRKMVADITVSNRSLNDITITEVGLINGKVNFNYTEVYKRQRGLNKDARIVVGQREAIRLVLSAEDLAKTLIQNAKGKVILKKVYVYAMDSTGVNYKGKVADVRKLLLQISKSGVDYLPPAFAVKSAAQVAPEAPQNDYSPAEGAYGAESAYSDGGKSDAAAEEKTEAKAESKGTDAAGADLEKSE